MHGYTPINAIYPMGRTTISYILEEWEPEAQNGVLFAWSFPTKEEATKKLLDVIQENGHRMAYRLYMSIDVWTDSSEASINRL